MKPTSDENRVLHLSNACLVQGTEDPCQLVLDTGGKKFVLCVLSKSNRQACLDLYMRASQSTKLLLRGKGEIHVVGYWEPDDGLVGDDSELDGVLEQQSKSARQKVAAAPPSALRRSGKTEAIATKPPVKESVKAMTNNVTTTISGGVGSTSKSSKQKVVPQKIEEVDVEEEDDDDIDEKEEEGGEEGSSEEEEGGVEGEGSSGEEVSEAEIEDDDDEEDEDIEGKKDSDVEVEDEEAEDDDDEEEDEEMKAFAQLKQKGKAPPPADKKRKMPPAASKQQQQPAKKKPNKGKQPDGDITKFEHDVETYLKAHGRTPLSALGASVKKPASVEKLGMFMRERPQKFAVENGFVSLIKA